ncbi:Na(+)/H(+) exchange regulatory cofactor NHE-RF2 isoform X4 [Orcinus orca]|uniref:Na(+)/H(+) exchange regulatory cofactor NHE-RF2 isoform X4 n=1 Tax=Orcinus orca TaxID=9733 RepID=UPI0014410B72|nr:Na(+)/H(+) exchange regulatory cofactor NHE-RF2 isoform X4 [Orcinus orca]
MSCSRTVLCSEVRVPSFASLSPQPWVLGAGQGLPAVSFLPFLGRKPGRWGTPGWSLRRGGGLSHHPAPQSDSALCPHPSLGSLGHSGRWINGVAAWAGWRAQATPAGRSPLAASVPPPMARSGSATPPSPAPGALPRSPSRRLVQDVNGPLRELRPRLCHLQKGPQGYGFNLHSDKSRPGQYIRSVDPGSPAAHSGLRAQDRLIEVNGQNVEGLRHVEVVASIKAREDEARLLVVDPETDEHFKRLRVTPTEEHVEGWQHLEARPFSGERPPPEPHCSRGQGEGESHQGQQAGTADGLEPEARDLQQLLSPPCLFPAGLLLHGPWALPLGPAQSSPQWTGGDILTP